MHFLLSENGLYPKKETVLIKCKKCVNDAAAAGDFTLDGIPRTIGASNFDANFSINPCVNTWLTQQRIYVRHTIKETVVE